MYLKDCKTSKKLSDHLKWVKFSWITWTLDNLGFLYTKYEEHKSLGNKDIARAGTETDKDRAKSVYYHRVGTKQEDDVLIYENPDNPLEVYFTAMSSCGKYLMNN